MVALSFTESKYIGLANTEQHLTWLRSFCEKLDKLQDGATELRCDNQVAIILTKDPWFRARSKHIQCKYHSVCDGLVATGEAALLWYPTDDMVADIFTKVLPHYKLMKFCHAMGLRLVSSGSVRRWVHPQPVHVYGPCEGKYFWHMVRGHMSSFSFPWSFIFLLEDWGYVLILYNDSYRSSHHVFIKIHSPRLWVHNLIQSFIFLQKDWGIRSSHL